MGANLTPLKPHFPPRGTDVVGTSISQPDPPSASDEALPQLEDL